MWRASGRVASIVPRTPSHKAFAALRDVIESSTERGIHDYLILLDFYPAFLGHSVGHWEGDTLVVEKTALDLIGHPHSEALRITERLHRRDFGHMDLEMTFDAPKMYSRPFTIKVPHDPSEDADIFESFCTENEKDSAHLGKSSLRVAGSDPRYRCDPDFG
jgi:hypothetical protein